MINIRPKAIWLSLLILLPTQIYSISQEIEVRNIRNTYGTVFITKDISQINFAEFLNYTVNGRNMELFLDKTYYALVETNSHADDRLHLLKVEFSESFDQILSQSIHTLPFNRSIYQFGLAFDGINFWTMTYSGGYDEDNFFPWGQNLIKFSLNEGLLSNLTLPTPANINDPHNGYYFPRLWLGYHENVLWIFEKILNTSQKETIAQFTAYDPTTLEVVESVPSPELSTYSYIDMDISGIVWVNPRASSDLNHKFGPNDVPASFWGLNLSRSDTSSYDISYAVAWGDVSHYNTPAQNVSDDKFPYRSGFQGDLRFRLLHDSSTDQLIGFHLWDTEIYTPTIHYYVSGGGIIVWIGVVAFLIIKKQKPKDKSGLEPNLTKSY